MRSDLKRNEIGPSLGTFWVRHWLIFLSSKATAFIYLVGSKERPPQSRPISSPQSKTNHFEFNSVSVVYLWTFSWSYISLRSQGKIEQFASGCAKVINDNAKLFLSIFKWKDNIFRIESYFYVYPLFFSLFLLFIGCVDMGVVSISHLAALLRERECRKQLRMVFYHRASVHLLDCHNYLLPYYCLMNMQKIEHVLHHYYFCGRWRKYLCKWITIYDMRISYLVLLGH